MSETRHAEPETVDAARFKAGMRLFGGAVTVLATPAEDRPTGLTATAVCSLSAEPPRLLACVNRDRFTYRAIAASRVVSVNLLHAAQSDIARLFAGMSGGTDIDRFAEVDWTWGRTGAPVLTEALAVFDCKVPAILDSGSHGIVIGDVVDIRINEALSPDPLLYADGQFATLSPARD